MKKFTKPLTFLTMFLFIITGLLFANPNKVSAQTLTTPNINNLSKVQKDELVNAFTRTNIDNSLKKFDFTKSGKQTVQLSANCAINCTVTSTTQSKSLVDNNLKTLNSIKPLYYSTTTKQVSIDATAFLSNKVWALYLSGTFGYNGSTVNPIDYNVSGQTYMVGWGTSNSSGKNISISSTQAKATGTAQFYLGFSGNPIQSFQPVIAVGCNQYGQTIKYSN